MNTHEDIRRMAEKAFADHRIKRGPGLSWRCAKPGTGNYAFRVTWTPGALMLTGDLGEATYTVWPSFNDPYAAAEFVTQASYDYMTSKARVEKVYAPEATIKHILQLADAYMKEWGDFSYWEKIVQRWGRAYDANPRNGAHQMQAAAELRMEQPSAEQIYDAFGDAELITYELPPRTRWHYEAMRVWAPMALASEPAWSRARRALRRAHARLRSYKTHPVRYRPDVYKARTSLNGSEFWAKTEKRWAAVRPWRVMGVDLSRAGFWRDQGSGAPLNSSWPTEYGFTPISQARSA